MIGQTASVTVRATTLFATKVRCSYSAMKEKTLWELIILVFAVSEYNMKYIG